MATRYPIRAVAKITGISLDTLRAWERRYRAVVPERSERGRQYGPGEIERLLLLSRLVQNGHAIGGIAALSDQELRGLLEQQPELPRGSESSSGDILAPVFAAIESFDSGKAWGELSRLAAVLPPRDLVYRVAIPLMREVGVRWHNGTIAISQEHLVSQILRNLLGSMTRLYQPRLLQTGDAAVKMVLATLPGETHEFGILASAMLASMAGIEPVYLGTNLPYGEIASAAARTAAQVIVLGVTFPAETTAGEIAALASALPEATELWVGGAGLAVLNPGQIAGEPGQRALLLKDFPAFEFECQRLGRMKL